MARFVGAQGLIAALRAAPTGGFNADLASDEVRLVEGLLPEPAVSGLVLLDACRHAAPGDPGLTWDRTNPHGADESVGSPPAEGEPLPQVRRASEVGARLSGFRCDECLICMHITYLVVTALAALMNGYAAMLNFAGAESVKADADRLQISRRWMLPFGILLASGAVGLLVGTAVPAVGMSAAIGLVLYFICAVTAHLRAHDTHLGGALFFLLAAIAALVTNVAYHNNW